MTPDEATNPHHNLLRGLIEGDEGDIEAMVEILDVHSAELFEWIEEYMIDYESNGYHKVNLKAFVGGIRYLIFYKLAGEEHGKTRITSDMYRRLVSIEVGMNRDAWGATIDRCDASEAEAKAFRDMIRHGVTEERIERLQDIDYIIEE